MQKRLVIFVIVTLALLITLSARASLDYAVYLPLTQKGDGNDVKPTQESPKVTQQPTETQSPTASPTPTSTMTETPTPTATETLTPTSTFTATPTPVSEAYFIEMISQGDLEQEVVRLKVFGDRYMTGWSLWWFEYGTTQKTKIYDFPQFFYSQWYDIYVHTRVGSDSERYLYMNYDIALYNGDVCLDLVDPEGWIHDTICSTPDIEFMRVSVVEQQDKIELLTRREKLDLSGVELILNNRSTDTTIFTCPEGYSVPQWTVITIWSSIGDDSGNTFYLDYGQRFLESGYFLWLKEADPDITLIDKYNN